MGFKLQNHVEDVKKLWNMKQKAVLNIDNIKNIPKESKRGVPCRSGLSAKLRPRSESELQSWFCVHFQTNTLEKWMSPFLCLQL